MSIYLIMDGNICVKAYKKIEDARAQMDVLMFTKCKRGSKIIETKNGNYVYCDSNNELVKYRLYIDETELQE